MLNGGFVRVTEAAREYGQDGAHEKLAAELAITEPGYVYIYLSNDNAALGGDQTEVFFDDFNVLQVSGTIVQMDDYYPFGLVFNSYQKENSVPQKYKYNGKELQNDLQLNWLEYGARMYQPDLGRWFVADPLSEFYENFSPYNYALNNPNRFIDPNGMAAVETDTSIVFTGKEAVDLLNILKNGNRNADNSASEAEMLPAAALAAQKQLTKEGFKIVVGGSLGYISLLLTLQGDTGPNYYSHEVAEEKMSKFITEGNLLAAKQFAEEYNKRNNDKIVFRYLSVKEGVFIGKTMLIENCDQNLNIVRKYITPDFYTSSSAAKSLLALPYAPKLGVWSFQSDIQGTKLPRIGWDQVQPLNSEPGGGNEGTIKQAFPVRGAFLLGE